MENEMTLSATEPIEMAASEATARAVAKSTVKDSVFRDLFENTKYLLQLYRVLHPEDETATEAEIGTVTIENILLDQMYNDLGFIVKGKLLVLVESQSNWSVNIIIRILLYLTETWNAHIQATNQNPYGTKKLVLPEPEFYVIYTGDRKDRTEWYSLSKEFFDGHESRLEVKVKVLYDGKKGDIINQYVTFTKVYNEQVGKYGRTREAVLETIRICKDSDVLKEYLESREKEVVNIMMTLFKQEYAVERYVEEKSAEAQAEGEMQKARDMAVSLAKMGIPVDKIAEAAKVSMSVVKQWLEGNAMHSR